MVAYLACTEVARVRISQSPRKGAARNGFSVRDYRKCWKPSESFGVPLWYRMQPVWQADCQSAEVGSTPIGTAFRA